MNTDELQVLGTNRKEKKHYKLTMAIVALVAMAIGAGLYWALSPKQPEKIKTGEKMGNSTIIPQLQHAVDTLLTGKLIEIGGEQGQVIVMEVQTGKILSMVGLERNFEGKYQPCNNVVFQQELGSLMQTVSLLAVLETGKAKLSDIVDAGNGVLPVNDEYTMRDHNWHYGGNSIITLDKALSVGSNIGISKTTAKVFENNNQQFFGMLESMSFGQPDTVERIRGLKPTSYRSPKDADWKNWIIWRSAIGYERKIAPIQMLTFYNALANGGRMVKPTLKTGEVEIINPQIASKANIDSIQRALEHVVTQGTGKAARSIILNVAGKTGTSQVKEHEFGEEMIVSEYQISFCGYYPADAPKYSIIVSLNKIGMPASGGMAGSVFHDIVEWMITHDMPRVLIVDEKTNDTVRLTKKQLE